MSSSKMKLDEQLSCAMCKKKGAPSCNTCAGCGSVAYCNAVCQKAHWVLHRPDCTRIKKEKKEREKEKEKEAKAKTKEGAHSSGSLGRHGVSHGRSYAAASAAAI